MTVIPCRYQEPAELGQIWNWNREYRLDVPRDVEALEVADRKATEKIARVWSTRKCPSTRRRRCCILSAAARGASVPSSFVQDRKVEAIQDKIASNKTQCACDSG